MPSHKDRPLNEQNGLSEHGPSNEDRPFPANPEITTFRYRGPDRRENEAPQEQEKAFGEVKFDSKGNPVWETRVDVPRRRKEDDTIDLLKCLDDESLSLADEQQAAPDAEGYNPYRRDDGSS